MSPLVVSIVAGIAIAGVTGAVSWIVATTRTVARLESTRPTDPGGMTPHKELLHHLVTIRANQDEIDRRITSVLEAVRGVAARLETEERYRWPQQDQAIAAATEAVRDSATAQRQLLGWLARYGRGGRQPID